MYKFLISTVIFILYSFVSFADHGQKNVEETDKAIF